MATYDGLAAVYDWLVPDALLSPQGSVAAFAAALEGLAPGSRVLDCACGTGTLAVGLALAGYDVAATDASPAMITRTNALATEHGVDPAMPALAVRWDALGASQLGTFDAVLCVGNSLTHAEGSAARVRALAAMAALLRPFGRLAVTSRNWELVRALGPRLEVTDELVVRGGVAGLVARAWFPAVGWDEEHHQDVAVGLLGPGDEFAVHREFLAFWPFTHVDLVHDLVALGLDVAVDTYERDAERYLVVATSVTGGRG